ncbi:mercuric reductase [Hymenobacter sp. BRD128]|uniref:mercuric reductase n=1 Tax=Hymenobacter sp. BRD128 TaxID=2675878 RepID=UPI001566A1E0|nr:mercuric reductase [Hymenobacter sp. BRD128]QKG55424.1 mercuric reductase [Hymenobacter sp. BRD128]
MSDYSCDALIIGSGQAGNPLATALAEAGRTVILVEEAHLGGSCVNYGCVPTKTILASAERLHQVRTAAALGIRLGGEATVDMPAVIARKDALLAHSRHNLHEALVRQHPNLTVLHGHAAFTGKHTVRVQETQREASDVRAKQIFINTGTRPAVPDVPGLADAGYLTTTSLLDIQEVPEHLLILGGGYIGLEFGQMFRRFGSRVTIIETGHQLLEREDDDVCECLQKALTQDGIELLLEAQARRVSRNAAGELTTTLDTPHGERRLHGSHLLVAVGRRPNSDSLNLEATGIQTDEKGYIQVNSRLQTSARHIYALGDVHGGPQFTHISYDDFRVVRDNLLHRGRRSAKQRPLPYCVFTDPQLGRIGLSESQAEEQKIDYRVSKLPVRSIGRAQQTGQQTGFWKVLVGPDDRILGAAIVGPEAGDIMTILQVAMTGRLRYQQLQNMVIAHPIWAEGLNVVWKELAK